MKIKAIAATLRTPAAFRTWLLRQPSDQSVGVACRPDACPLATYLGALTGHAWDVADQVALGDGSLACATPDWALAFITFVDAHDDDERITAGLAARLLDEALAQQATA